MSVTPTKRRAHAAFESPQNPNRTQRVVTHPRRNLLTESPEVIHPDADLVWNDPELFAYTRRDFHKAVRKLPI